jgi:nitroreductase
MAAQNPISPAQLLEALNWRYATKAFDPDRKIDTTVWRTLQETLVLAPSSYGLQPWKFIAVHGNPALQEKLMQASWNQTQPRDASHFVVFAVRKNIGADHLDRYIARTAEVRGTPVESLVGFRGVIAGSLENARAKGTLDTWQSHQIYIALGQFMTAAALLGVDTCPMEGIDRAKFDELLDLDVATWTTVVACAAGYRSATDKYATTPKVRFALDEVFETR